MATYLKEDIAALGNPINDYLAGEPAASTDFASMDPATRQLLVENASAAQGGAGRNTPVARDFISGDLFNRRSSGGSMPAGAGGTMPAAGSAPQVSQGAVNQVDGALGGNNLVDTITQRYSNFLGGGLSEQQILDQERQAIQGQMDLINAQYDQQMRQLRGQIQNEVGRTRSLNTISGTMFSPRGAADTANTEQKGANAMSALERERYAALAAAEGTATSAARQRAAQQSQQALAATSSFVDDLTKAYALSQDEQAAIRNNAVQIAQLTGYLNGDPTLSRDQFNQSIKQYLQDVAFQVDANNRANKELDLKVEQVRRDGFQTTQLPDGTIGYYDFTSGAPKFVPLGNYAKITSGGSGGSGSGISGPGGNNYDALALLQYQQATGAIPAGDVATQNVIRSWYAGMPQNASYDPYSQQNPFGYPSRAGGGAGGYYDENGNWVAG